MRLFLKSSGKGNHILFTRVPEILTLQSTITQTHLPASCTDKTYNLPTSGIQGEEKDRVPMEMGGAPVVKKRETCGRGWHRVGLVS